MTDEEIRIERFQHRLAVACVVGCIIVSPFVNIYWRVFGRK